jgi:hypothetical protein
MFLTFQRNNGRTQLIIKRDDDSTERAELGPTLPYHDLAHYIVEKQFQLTDGFYGHINKGYSVAQLSDKNIIKTLPQEALVAEILARALQSLGSGACSAIQFIDLINEELEVSQLTFELNISSEEIPTLLNQYKKIVKQWNELNSNESLQLIW